MQRKNTFFVRCHFCINENIFYMEICYDGDTYFGTIKKYEEKTDNFFKIGSIGFCGSLIISHILPKSHFYIFMKDEYKNHVDLIDFFNKKLNLIHKTIFGI